MEDSERIEETLKKMSRNDKLSVVYGKQDLHSFMNQSRPEGLSDQQRTGPRLRFVSISEIVQEESKDPELEENKDIFEDQGYDLSEEEQMTKAQKVAQKKADKEKRYQRVEILHSLGYSTAQIAEDSQVKMSKDTIKRWKSKIRQEGSIWRSEGSGRPKKLNNEHHLFILNLLHSSPFNTSKRIVYKLQNKFGLKIDRSTVSRFLVERGFKWKGPQVVFRNNEVDQKSRLEFCKENKEREWENVVFTDEASVYFVSPGKQRWVSPGEAYERTKTKYSKKLHVWGAFSSKGVIELQTFENNMDSQKYIEILEKSKDQLNELHLNRYILLCDNDSKHRSGISLDYYIQNDIRLLEWPAYSPDLNPIENIWANIKNKLGARVYNNKDTLEADIKYYWNVYAKDYSEIVVHSMKKRIDACILKGGKRTGY